MTNQLDLSEFHPLDPRPASARCRSLPGGWRNHLRLAWDFTWSPKLAAQTLCRLGRHHWVHGWSHDQPCSLCRNRWRDQPR